MLADTLSVLAHTSKGGWAPDGDDRYSVDHFSELDHAEIELAPTDIVLLCTAGVWNQDNGEELVLRLLTATLDGFRKCLDATARSRGRDATAVRLNLGGG